MKNVPTFQKFRALSSYALGNFEVSVNPAQRAANSGQTIKCRELACDTSLRCWNLYRQNIVKRV